MSQRKTGNTRRALTTGAALLFALGVLAPALAAASTLNVKIADAGARRRNVAIRISGGALGTQDQKLTRADGVAKFTGIPGDVYTVLPAKAGFRFTPASRLVTLPDGATRGTSFKIASLPAVGALSVSATSLDLPKTLSATVVVTATDGAGRGIEGATISAASSDSFYVLVRPATAVADSLGRASFTLTAFGSIGFSAARAPLSLPAISVETVTFTSGGWRGTPVRTAQTAVTVQQALEASLWLASGHSDAAGEPFSHWDGDGAIPTSCARCHSRPGFLDYAADGTVNAAAPIGTTVDCLLCHDPLAMALTTATFNSGVTVTGLGHEAVCMTCHQGISSTDDVNTRLGVKPEDTVDAAISFSNIHYFAAAATQYGSVVRGGYQYPGLPYDGRADHVSTQDTCLECHDPHSLALRLEDCRACHPGATDYAGVRNIRMAGSTQDYDGDGNVTEGVWYEIEGLAERLYREGIQPYAALKGFRIVYDRNTYPYFFKDLDADGAADPAELVYPNGYKSWTPRLLKAAYNYQVYQKDPGSHGHNAKYIIELLHDSLQSLASQLPAGAIAGLARNDLNHFDSSSEAFRHWDVDPSVSASCSRCHGGTAGFLKYITTGTTIAVPQVSKMACELCHVGTDFAGAAPRRYVDKVVFPTYAADPAPLTIYNDPVNPDDSFICMTCHQGRQSKRTYDDYLTGYTDNQVMPSSKSFRNIHYLSAGATLYGKQAGGGYEYAGKTYAQKFTHWGGDSPQCSYCHDVSGQAHTFQPRLTPVCVNCHTEIVGGDIETIRLNRPFDYDGDGNTTEKLKAEIDGLRQALLAQIKVYAAANGGAIAYSESGSYYYFDANGNGAVDTGEVKYDGKWTPRLMKAAHNYHMTFKEPGEWAHNTNYAVQLLIDSIADLGGNVAAFQRPVGF